MEKGDRVICGEVNMRGYKLDGGWERRWFTDKEGELLGVVEGVFPVGWSVRVGGRDILLHEDEMRPV